MTRAYHCISADSHLEVPPERWTVRMPKKYRDRAPRRIDLADGSVAVMVEGQALRISGLELCGKPFDEWSPIGVRHEDSPGTGSPEQRLREQDLDGVDAEVLFTGVG